MVLRVGSAFLDVSISGDCMCYLTLGVFSCLGLWFCVSRCGLGILVSWVFRLRWVWYNAAFLGWWLYKFGFSGGWVCEFGFSGGWFRV